MKSLKVPKKTLYGTEGIVKQKPLLLLLFQTSLKIES